MVYILRSVIPSVWTFFPILYKQIKIDQILFNNLVVRKLRMRFCRFDIPMNEHWINSMSYLTLMLSRETNALDLNIELHAVYVCIGNRKLKSSSRLKTFGFHTSPTSFIFVSMYKHRSLYKYARAGEWCVTKLFGSAEICESNTIWSNNINNLHSSYSTFTICWMLEKCLI